jgi:hypothetical protein
MSAQVDSNQLLSVVDRIATKLILQNDDNKLQDLLEQFLPKLLSLLLYNDEAVRNKVLHTLTSLNKRVKSNNAIKLPFLALLDLYLISNQSPFLKNFTTIYLDMAFDRLDAKQRLEVFPVLCEKLKKLSLSGGDHQQQDDTLLRFMLQILPSVEIPVQHSKHSSVPLTQYQQELSAFKRTIFAQTEEEESKQMEDAVPGHETIPPHVQTILDFFKDVLLFRANYSLTGERFDVPSGLSIGALRRIVGNVNSGKFTLPQVTQMKVRSNHKL